MLIQLFLHGRMFFYSQAMVWMPSTPALATFLSDKNKGVCSTCSFHIDAMDFLPLLFILVRWCVQLILSPSVCICLCLQRGSILLSLGCSPLNRTSSSARQACVNSCLFLPAESAAPQPIKEEGIGPTLDICLVRVSSCG